MSPLHDNLAAAYAALARRPIPCRWNDPHPELDEHRSVDDLVNSIVTSPRSEHADVALRALIHLARADDPDAFVVTLAALIPAIPDRCGPCPSDAFLAEVLSDLVFVVIEAPDVDDLDDLSRRLTRRAYRRSRRRYEADKRYSGHTSFTDLAELTDPVEPWDHEQVITDRAQLVALWQHMDRAIARGRLSAEAWRLYRAGRLATAVGGFNGADATRSQLYRASLAVKREVRRSQIGDQQLSHA